MILPLRLRLESDRHARRAKSPRMRAAIGLELLESRRLLATFTVTNTADNGSDTSPTPGSLRAAIVDSNEDTPGPNHIVFAIPASTAPNLDVPVSGFDPDTQTWAIDLTAALPAITTPVNIDGFTQAHVAIPYLYPDQEIKIPTTEFVAVNGIPSGGTFTLGTSSPLPIGTTVAIPFDATASLVQADLEAIVGVGNVSVSGSEDAGYIVTFQGAYDGIAIPNLTAVSNLTGGINPSVVVSTTGTGQTTYDPPIEITSSPNTTQAIDGNNAAVRVIVDGSGTGGATGFTIDASDSMIRGLIIDGFGVGVDVPNSSDQGDSIQGNFIGAYLLYPVDPDTGEALPSPDGEELVTPGNSQQGVIINGQNTTLGGAASQDDNVIAGNGAEGVWLQDGSVGSQVLGNQVGVVGPSDYGVYWSVGNGAEGVLVQSSSDLIGVSGAGNIISANDGDGVQLDQGATQVQVAGNFIGVAPGGGFVFGNEPPGNHGDGVNIIGGADNTIGGSSSGAGNAISANLANGVDISGSSATGNVVSNNMIGVTSDGSEALGNSDDGVVVASSQTQIGPGNVISANQVGVNISGSTITGITVIGNLIGTDATGELDLGNAFEGVLIQGAGGVTIEGNADGSQVISGNTVGVEITGPTSSGSLILGNFIGTDKTGTIPLPNAQQGILIEDVADNTIGGTATTSRNVISTNDWGVQLDGPSAVDNSILGNFIGTDLTGQLALGNEIDGVLLSNGASNNTIGGTGSGDANTIAFNQIDGVLVASGTGDAILSNSIFSNGVIGISLSGTANDSIESPTLTLALPDSALDSTEVQGSYAGAPNSTYLIQFFSNAATDPSGYYEGQTWIGSTTIKTGSAVAPGDVVTATFSVDLATVVTPGFWITATVTFLAPTPSIYGLTAGDTSGFSQATEAINPFLITSTADQPADPAVGTLRYAIDYANANPSLSASTPNDITFSIAAGGLQTIELQASLPAIAAPLVIDGYSQSGTQTNDSSQYLAPDTVDDQETDIATILIQLDGSEINSTTADGLTVAAPGCTIDGLSITGFGGAGIVLAPGSTTITGSLGDTVWGNFIGVTQFNSRGYNPVNPVNNPYANGVGILIDSPNNVIGGASPPDRNLIQGNTGDGVIVYGSQGTGNTIDSNFILDNGGDGVLLLSADNHVGQASGLSGPAGAGNLISGNSGNGVHILDPAAKGNTIANNEIGTQVGLAGLNVPILGTAARPNAGAGVLIEDAPANVVGGQVTDSGNVIAGNTGDGVVIENYVDGTIPSIVTPTPTSTGTTAATSNIVQGNLIGCNDRNSLVEPIPNRDGVFIASSGNLVGGNTAAAQNTIVDNGRNGVTISGTRLDAADNPTTAIPNATPSSNVVEGNFIGTVSGSDDNANKFDGVFLYGAGDNTVGGTASGAGNVIANNGAGIVLEGSAATGNLIAANRVGTTSDGSAPLGNATDGVEILNAPANLIGGTAAGAGNVIAGNGAGVHLSGSGTTGNILWGNLIGTNSSGSDLIGNTGDGVTIDGNASSNTIGGTTAGAANTIAFNGGSGIGISSGTGNSALSNAIVSNAQLGIVLSGSGNDAQAAPALTASIPSVTTTLIQGSLTSAPGTSFLIQFFSNATADPSGYGQGQTLIGSTVVTTNSSGSATINLTLSSALASDLAVSATATNLSTGDTSAFSNDTLTSPVDVQFAAAAFSADESSGSATISVTRTGNLGATVSVAYATGGGTAVAGVNYTATHGTMVFNPNQSVQTFTIRIDTNTPPSSDLTVDLTLSGPTGGAVLGTPSTAMLTIVDTRAIDVQFSASTYTADESSGSAILTVTRNSPAGSTTVAYATSGGTAVPGIEYTATSGTIYFSPGQTTATFAVPLEGSLTQSGVWTVGLALSDPTGASLGTPAGATLTLTASAGTLSFSAAAVAIPESAGNVVIAVDRVGGSSGTVGVTYASSAISAIPGVDFSPVSGTLTFPPGVTQESFNLPIVSNSGNPYDATVALTLIAPTGGALLGSPSTETITIDKPLIVTSEQLSTNGAGITAVTFSFNAPLDPTQAQNLANYGAFVIAAGPGGVFGNAASGSTPIRSAVYNPANLTVTLTPAVTLRMNQLDRIVIDGAANSLLNTGLTDANGDLLAGSSGAIGTPFVATFGAGTRLAYTDGASNVVTLRLTRGGLMELFQSPDGSIQQLRLVGTVPKKSTLTGTVRHGSRPGHAALPPITGSSGVRIRLKPPAFLATKARSFAIVDKSEPHRFGTVDHHRR